MQHSWTLLSSYFAEFQIDFAGEIHETRQVNPETIQVKPCFEISPITLQFYCSPSKHYWSRTCLGFPLIEMRICYWLMSKEDCYVTEMSGQLVNQFSNDKPIRARVLSWDAEDLL